MRFVRKVVDAKTGGRQKGVVANKNYTAAEIAEMCRMNLQAEISSRTVTIVLVSGLSFRIAPHEIAAWETALQNDGQFTYQIIR